MACRGELYAIGPADVRALLDLAANAACDDEVAYYALEECRDEAFVAYLDKAWYGIGCCLRHLGAHRGGPSVPDGCVLGGRPLTSGEDWIVTLWKPAEVVAGAALLQGVTKASLRHAYDAWDADEVEAYPEYGDGEDFEYVWSYFEAARTLCARAVASRRAVLFIVDQ